MWEAIFSLQIDKNPNAVSLNAFGTHTKRVGMGGSLNQKSRSWEKKEDNKLIQFLNFQYSSVCGSYSQRITGSHRILKFICIVM